jgi:uncharacterized protein (UPF0332 family)
MRKFAVEINSHLEQVITALQAAKEFLEKGQYDLAVSRASDAAFHTASTLLLDEEIEPGKHGDVITLIHEIFVNGRRLTKEQGADLSWLFATRNAAQSEKSPPAASEDAPKAVQIAESFFEAAKVILDS